MRALRMLTAAVTVLIIASFHGAPRAGPPRTKAVDLLVVSERVFVPGTRAAVRVTARAVASLTASRPLPNAEIAILLASKDKQQQVFAGRSDARGAVEASFKLPDWPLGSYKMTIQLKSPQGDSSLEQTVDLKRPGRVLLVTDKPIYQPRQPIHIRALVLGVHDLRPVKNEMIRFEVQDPKGNKVFRKDLRSNAFGIVSTIFQLADEINMGNYQIEAAPVRRELAEPAAKTVVVKRYVLPKFKVGVETDHPYYLPKQTVKGKLRSDYFFGKPVAGGKVVVEASTFDGVSFRKFSTVKGQTGKDGTWAFEIVLPDYFVGQPLLKGDALVKIEAKVTDTAHHSEIGIRSTPVAATPIRVTAMPESGRLVAGVDNQIYVVATYPDGSPAQATVTVKATQGNRQIARLQTDASGLGSFSFTPNAKEMRNGTYRSRLVGGVHAGYIYTRVLDVSIEAKDAKGQSATATKSFDHDPDQDTILLRTDKAIYRAGDTLDATVLTTGGGPDTVYVDLIKNRQTLLTRAVYLTKNRGALRLPLGGDAFGSVELHAYRIQTDGEIARDGRVLYIQPPTELAIEVSPDQKVYRPGGRAAIRFRVTDGKGKPQAAALGVVIVDEAVYALQEIQPGLEKVFFTLERELSKPKVEIEFAPSDNISAMIKVPQVDQRRQRIAKALLSGARPATTPAIWDNPMAKRLQQAQQQHWTIRSALASALFDPKLRIVARGGARRWIYHGDVIGKLVKAKRLTAEQAKDPLGEPYTAQSVEQLWPDCAAQSLVGQQELGRLWNLRSYVQSELHRRTSSMTKLGKRSLESHLQAAFAAALKGYGKSYAIDPLGKPYTWGYLLSLPGFRVQDFAGDVHENNVRQIYYALSTYAARRAQAPGAFDKKRNIWNLPGNAVAATVRSKLLSAPQSRDLWGHTFTLRKRAKERRGGTYYYDQRLRLYDVVSAGPDGQLGTADDLVYPRKPEDANSYQKLSKALGIKDGAAYAGGRGGPWGGRGGRWRDRGGFGGGGGAPMARKAARAMDFEDDARAPRAEAAPMPVAAAQIVTRAGEKEKRSAADPAAPQVRQVRVREYFPETLLFAPSVITDERGEAKIDLTMADSITTWRMTASANSPSGSLGSTSQALRVFQDFFVDIDLPVSLTQNDEVSVPIVVYNYLKQPQRVRLELKAASWFELLNQQSRVQELRLEPQEVRATYYRARVRELGRRMFEVRADGSSMSDAIRRELEVLPDGQEQNLVANGRLQGNLTQMVDIPQSSVEGASKIIVRLYPGIFSQVIEGMESMLRLPYG